MKRLILIAILFAVAAWAAQGAYVVILNDGKRVVGREKYTVKGNNALLTLKNGTLVAIPLDHINVEATEKLNARNLGDAMPLDWADVQEEDRPVPTPTPTPSLTTLGGIRKGVGRPINEAARPTPTPGIAYTGAAYSDPRVVRAFEEGLERSRLYLYRVGRGTRPNYLVVELQVNGKPEVNKGLLAVCEVYHILATTAPDRTPERIEIRMLNESGREAGLFRLGPEEAAELATGRVTAVEFFQKHVIF
ncbi:MAG: hypothetical protein HRF46_14555 [Acidobacteriota bacterium]